ncbi:MAG: DUF1080 domain-containing protein [Fimbriimonadaceae bacterium]|nr:DUF1080 domain-containing protein [Fimbriimonadaceae bacterium]
MVSGLLLLCVASAAPVWEPLFDGKTLNGWTQLNGSARYRVEGGQIVGASVPNSPNSFLCTDRVFGDFELEFEVKCDPRLNSGVQIRSNRVPGYDNGRVHGYQVEIDGTDSGYPGGVYDEARRGWLVDPDRAFLAGRAAFKREGWNKYRVVAKGDRLQTWINGKPVADLRDDLTRTGFVALQVHAVSTAEPLEVRWRNLRLKDYGIPTLSPPKEGKWLLRTEKDRANWVSEANPANPCPWPWDGEGLTVQGGDLMTKESFGDARFHVEFMTDENGKEGQANGNSGVYLQRSYEVQVLNSAPRGPLDNECGGIYGVKAPDYAMAYPAGVWQTYDIEFVAPRWDGNRKVSSAKLTVYHNGTRIHKDVEVPRGTTAGFPEAPGDRPLKLQDHGNRVRYRNIWVAPLGVLKR